MSQLPAVWCCNESNATRSRQLLQRGGLDALRDALGWQENWCQRSLMRNICQTQGEGQGDCGICHGGGRRAIHQRPRQGRHLKFKLATLNPAVQWRDAAQHTDQIFSQTTAEQRAWNPAAAAVPAGPLRFLPAGVFSANRHRPQAQTNTFTSPKFQCILVKTSSRDTGCAGGGGGHAGVWNFPLMFHRKLSFDLCA